MSVSSVRITDKSSCDSSLWCLQRREQPEEEEKHSLRYFANRQTVSESLLSEPIDGNSRVQPSLRESAGRGSGYGRMCLHHIWQRRNWRHVVGAGPLLFGRKSLEKGGGRSSEEEEAEEKLRFVTENREVLA